MLKVFQVQTAPPATLCRGCRGVNVKAVQKPKCHGILEVPVKFLGIVPTREKDLDNQRGNGTTLFATYFWSCCKGNTYANPYCLFCCSNLCC